MGKCSLSGAVWREMLPPDSLRVSQQAELLSPLGIRELAVIMLPTLLAGLSEPSAYRMGAAGQARGVSSASTLCSHQELCQDLMFVRSPAG